MALTHPCAVTCLPSTVPRTVSTSSSAVVLAISTFMIFTPQCRIMSHQESLSPHPLRSAHCSPLPRECRYRTARRESPPQSCWVECEKSPCHQYCLSASPLL